MSTSPTAELLRIENLVTTYPAGQGSLRSGRSSIQAVSDVSLELAPGETLGLVGESGCGKSTLARSVVGLVNPRSGRVILNGRDMRSMKGREARAARRAIQMVFQDPYSSLNPRMSIEELVSEPWIVHRGIVERKERPSEVRRLLDLVGLPAAFASRYPSQLSGGQLQRVSIARALAVRPQVLIADEAVSALDVSIQAQILNLLGQMRDELNLAVLFISHDLSVIRHICDRVAVMYLGKVVEIGRCDAVFARPSHPYTQMLMASLPVLNPWDGDPVDLPEVTTELPSPAAPPSGCRFRTRCWKAGDICATVEPGLVDRSGGQWSACHFAECQVSPVESG